MAWVLISSTLEADADRKAIHSANEVGIEGLTPPIIPPSSRSAHPIPPNAPYQTPQQMVRSPPTAHPPSAMRLATGNAPDAGLAARQGSTPGMDALADLASMQHHQQTTRANAGALRNTEIYDSQASPNGAVLQNLQVVHGPLPGRASLDHTVADVPLQPATTRISTTRTLSEDESQDPKNLAAHLASNPSDYESHSKLIGLLRSTFRSRSQGSSSRGIQADPRDLELLPDLRSAREAMDARFSLGEELWIERIEDEEALATMLSLNECSAVVDLYERAVQEEVVSTKLWLRFAQWMTSLYVAATQDALAREAVQSLHEVQGWSDEDKLVAGEVYNWRVLIDVYWARGVNATKWRIDQSHLLWDPYTTLLLQDLERSPSTEGVARMKAHFLDRLRTPHATWDQTFQMFSTFISRYEDNSYEKTMETVNKECATTKAAYGAREMFEFALTKAHGSGDKTTELRTFKEYIEWETSQNRRKNVFMFEFVDNLYQRALLGSPANAGWWEAYVMFLKEEIFSYSRHEVELLAVLDRSTRHCPWSGSLWSHYLIAAENHRIPWAEIEQVKHKATSTGVLDAGGLEEVLQVHVAWCDILRRRAFREGSGEDERDHAEMGIRSAIENMQRLGESKYGQDYQGDPNYRLERNYIEYWTQSHNWRTARDSWKSLVPSRGKSYDFWLRYYQWEMSVWREISWNENAANGTSSPKPREATRVLRTALKRPNLDWPERIIQELREHCRFYEDPIELQSVCVQIWKTGKVLQKKREHEAIEAWEAAQGQATQHVQHLNAETSVDSTVSSATTKRKRENEINELQGEAAPKKTRGNDENAPTMVEEATSSVPSKLRRDRENATVIVKNLPQATTETRVRQFFRDCGSINSLLLNVDEVLCTSKATIEFQSRDEALAAETKDKKDFDGREMEVRLGSGSTIFTTNFPPEADENWIREKFGMYGEIIDIRFPSLKYDTHRRFCYVQFSTADEAQKATQLNGQAVGAKLKLVAKMSDPSQRHDRVGALEEGREIHVVNLHWDVTEKELASAFSRYGRIEKTRIPTDVSGKSKGYAFVSFKSKKEADAALDLDKTKFMGRTMTVEIATKAPTKRQATTILRNNVRSSHSPSPDVQMTNGDQSAVGSPHASAPDGVKPSSAEIKARTVILLNVPDTVNDARIRALAERYGPLVKIVLRPDHQGAILEFSNVTDAGKAALGLDGDESLSGRTLRVGKMRELLNQQPEKKNEKLGPKTSKHTGALQSAMPVRRPMLGAKRGGRGGLGPTFRAPAKKLGEEAEDPEMNGEANAEEASHKSNADFKALYLGQKKDA
ncbi:MAG: hypothetical protein LQ339_005853 [Xanthoria mediterranea]|nr:MAG: hypothetical protein LQ339_005853 [Xanthoria mediterranea]